MLPTDLVNNRSLRRSGAPTAARDFFIENQLSARAPSMLALVVFASLNDLESIVLDS